MICMMNHARGPILQGARIILADRITFMDKAAIVKSFVIHKNALKH